MGGLRETKSRGLSVAHLSELTRAFVCHGEGRCPGYHLLVVTMSSRASRTIYVGNLPGDVREREIEDLFYKVP